jgi:hypothetical protein
VTAKRSKTRTILQRSPEIPASRACTPTRARSAKNNGDLWGPLRNFHVYPEVPRDTRVLKPYRTSISVAQARHRLDWSDTPSAHISLSNLHLCIARTLCRN